MKSTVNKPCNSSAVRIPDSVVRMVRQKTYDLSDLLKGITAKNLHEPIDFGSPQGTEIW